MNADNTNGYLVSILVEAQENVSHENHAEANKYLKTFRLLEEKFFSEVHPQVDIGLALSEAISAGDEPPNVFTTHGCRHISDLIKSLDKLAKAIEDPKSNAPKSNAATVLEAYILLSAAHLHDAANTFGRDDHAKRCDKILRQHKDLFVSSASQQIYDVARVHGGTDPEFDEDTLRSLDSDNSSPPRLPLLASFLRLGDELSENPERVPKTVVEHHSVSPLSKLAHAYAETFRLFELRQETLYISYGIYEEHHSFCTRLDGETRSFYDFLETKIDKIETESRYCSQYGRPVFNVSEIKVSISLYDGAPPAAATKQNLQFGLYLNHGYPQCSTALCTRSPELRPKKHLREHFQ